MQALRWFVVILSVLTGHAAVAADRPNIVFILADNLGWGELGAYGGGALRGAPTPRLDALAGQGLRLLNFNVETSCTPTRSALMTGRFAVRSGTLRSPRPNVRSGLIRWEVVLSQLLSDQGYATAHYGKWDLGDEDGRYPNDRGFDEWYGIPRSSHEALNRTSPQYDPAVTPPEYILEGKKGERTRRVKEYDMEARREIDGELAKRAAAFVEQSAKASRPFFVYVPLTQVHYPTIPSRSFEGRTGNGDFADSMVELDARVGEIIDAVEQSGAASNTIFIFASDNGPESRRPWQGNSGFWRGAYRTAMEGGIRTPFIIRWPGKVTPGVSNEIVHAVDIFTTLAHVGGAKVPADRPIDGVDQMDFFTGKQSKSNREGFPIYGGAELAAVKWRDWKYNYSWRATAEEEPEARGPQLFNLLLDPKEEYPRPGHEDAWVMAPINKIVNDMKASLEANPPIPYGADDSQIPKAKRRAN